MSVVCVVSQIYRSFFPFHSKTLKNLHKVHGGGQSVTFSSTPPSTALALGTNRASAYLAVECNGKNLFEEGLLFRIKYFTAKSSDGAFVHTIPLVKIVGRCRFATVFARKNHIFVFAKWTAHNVWRLPLKRLLRPINFYQPSISARKPKRVRQNLLGPTPAGQHQAQYQSKPSHSASILMLLHQAIPMFVLSNMLLLTVCYPSNLTGHYV